MFQNARRSAAFIVAAILTVLILPASVVAAEPTTTEIREPSNPFGWYEPIHLVALVRPTPNEAGLVTLSRGAVLVATDMTSPNGAANFSLPGLAPGTYSFVASFDGTTGSLPSTSAPLQVVVVDDRTPIAITIESGTNPSVRGDTVPFTVNVDPVPDTGQISVNHNGTATSEPLDPSGTNVIDHGFQDVGTFTVNACFGGSSVYQDTCTTVGVEQHVIAYDTTTTFSIDPMSLYVDEGLVIHARVDPAPDTPASVIVRRMWEPTLWTIPLDPVTGIGELTVPGEDVAARLEPGENELIAQYGGSDHMNQSNSDVLVVFGKQDATTIDLDIDADTITPGGSVTATATVDPAPPPGTILDFYLRRTESNYIYGYGSTDDAGVATATLLSVTNWPVGDYATVEVRFRGDLRRAPSMATKPLTIAYLDTLPPSFGFVLSDPDPSTATRSIVVESGVDGTGSPVVTAELSHDGIVWTEMPYARLLPWTLTAGDGLKTVWLRVTDAAGNVSGPGYYTIQLDTVAPTATAPTRSLVTGTAISASRLLARLAWSGSDVTSGIARYEIQQSTDAGAWSTVSTTLTSPTLDRLLAVSHRYAFRVRAIDEAGNTGTWMAGPTASLSHVSEKSSSIKFSSSWRQTYSTVFWGGGAKKSSTAGAKATVAFTGRSIALVSRLGPTRGRARIYVDGTLVTTVNLYASTYKSQRIVWARTFASSGKHAVSVVVYRTATRPRVDIDAFVVGG